MAAIRRFRKWPQGLSRGGKPSTLVGHGHDDFQPVAVGGRLIIDNLCPGAHDFESGAAAALDLFLACRGTRIEGCAPVGDDDVDAIWIAFEAQVDLVARGYACMIVEVGDQFLGNDAEPRALIVRQPLLL